MTFRFILAIYLVFALPLAVAQQIDPLWKRAQDTVLASKDLVSGDIAVDTIVVDEDGKNLDTIHKVTRLTHWKDGEPVRAVVNVTETKQSGLGELKFEWGVSNHPEQGLMNGGTVVRGETALFEGKTCIVFHVAGKKGKLPFNSKAWVEEATGLPLKADYVVHGIPMTKSMTYSVSFGRDENGRWLPQEVKINAFISAFFYKFKIQSKQRLTRWVSRISTPG